MESQIGYIQIQIHLWVTSRIPKLASRIPDCHFSEEKKQPWACPDSIGGLPESRNLLPESEIAIFSEKNRLEHARILSESFQNPRLPFFQKKNSLEHARILSEDFQIPYFAQISYFHLCDPCPDHNITKYPIFEYIPWPDWWPITGRDVVASEFSWLSAQYLVAGSQTWIQTSVQIWSHANGLARPDTFIYNYYWYHACSSEVQPSVVRQSSFQTTVFYIKNWVATRFGAYGYCIAHGF